MTDNQIYELLAFYEGKIDAKLAEPFNPLNVSEALSTAWTEKQLRHLLTMIPQMREMLATPRPSTSIFAAVEKQQEYAKQREKLMRWLGFMQGVLWSKGIFSIDEMREHNR